MISSKNISKAFAIVSLVVQASFALVSSGVTVPLYIDPGDSPACANWGPVITAIQTYTDLPFNIIINPNSGPGSAATPDTSYQGCIPLLRQSNVKILGYVPTTAGSRAPSAIVSDANTYFNWGSAYKPDGLFFDEVTSGSKNLPVYQNVTSGTRAIWGTTAPIMFNPGTTPVAGYFSLANFIVTFEDTYSVWQTTNLTINSAHPANQQVVLIHTAPAVLKTAVDHQLVSLGISSSFVTNFPDCAGTYEGYSSFFPDFVADIRSVQ